MIAPKEMQKAMANKYAPKPGSSTPTNNSSGGKPGSAKKSPSGLQQDDTLGKRPRMGLKKANSINPQPSSSGTILGLKSKRDAKQMGRKEHSNQKLTRQNSL